MHALVPWVLTLCPAASSRYLLAAPYPAKASPLPVEVPAAHGGHSCAARPGCILALESRAFGAKNAVISGELQSGRKWEHRSAEPNRYFVLRVPPSWNPSHLYPRTYLGT